MYSKGLSEEEEHQFIALASKLDARMTAELYNAIALKFATIAVEAVTLRIKDKVVEVLLAKRSENDVHYAGQWHSPGSILRAEDAPDEIDAIGDFGKAFKRIEVENGCRFKSIQFIDWLFHRVVRGPVLAMVFTCEIDGEPENGRFFPIDNLPEPFIEHHRPIISRAVAHYRQTKI